MFHVLGGGSGGSGSACATALSSGGGPAVPSLPLVVGAVARPEEKFIVFSALCFCFSCCLLLL